MYSFLSNGVSFSETTLIAKRDKISLPEVYSFNFLNYPNICIPNRAKAIMYGCLPEDSVPVVELKAGVEAYNKYLKGLEKIECFISLFQKSDYCLSRETVEKQWSNAIADYVFSLPHYVFSTNLQIRGEYIVDVSVSPTYTVEMNGNEVQIVLCADGHHYPRRMGDSLIFWNWVENGHDFCLDLWNSLGAPDCPTCFDNENDGGDNRPYYGFDYYDQIRSDPAEPQLVRIFNYLENGGFIKSYTIKPDDDDPRWAYFGKPDGTIDCAILDRAFLKDDQIMDYINTVLWSNA